MLGAMSSRFGPSLGALSLAGLLALASAPAHAIFGDDEARRAILDLRARVEANQAASEAANKALEAELRKFLEEQAAPSRRGMLDLINQLEALRSELAVLRGQNEQLMRDVAELQRQQADLKGSVDTRLRTFEPREVTVDGVEFVAQPAETAEFEAAMAVLRQSQFKEAAALYGQFVLRHPNSGYVPTALYWQGNALYAAREYQPAIQAYRSMIASSPTHPRVPESLLAIANCQLELKDARAAKATLEALVKAHPQSEAANAARDRLSRMR